MRAGRCTPSPEHPFCCRSTRDGEWAIAQALIREGVVLDVTDEHGWGAVHWAAAGGDLRTVQESLSTVL